MRNMSFMLTTDQMRDRTKTVTRRLGWRFLKPGDRVMACVKCMGLKRGEKIERIGEIEIVSVRCESLIDITAYDVTLEGFPGMTTGQFIDMFMRHNKCMGFQLVTRIEFRHVGRRGEPLKNI